MLVLARPLGWSAPSFRQRPGAAYYARGLCCPLLPDYAAVPFSVTTNHMSTTGQGASVGPFPSVLALLWRHRAIMPADSPAHFRAAISRWAGSQGGGGEGVCSACVPPPLPHPLVSASLGMEREAERSASDEASDVAYVACPKSLPICPCLVQHPSGGL